MPSYEITRSTSAPPERVFELLSDVPHWPRWARPLVMQARWENPDGARVGAVRAAGLWPFLVREEITELERPSRISYRYVGRWVPVRDYNATVELAPAASGGTDLRWSATFTNVLPGPLALWIARGTVQALSLLLMRAAGRS